jgi:hypothetical protein
MPSTSAAIAVGWSPAGWYSDTSSNRMPPSDFSGRGGRCGVHCLPFLNSGLPLSSSADSAATVADTPDVGVSMSSSAGRSFLLPVSDGEKSGRASARLDLSPLSRGEESVPPSPKLSASSGSSPSIGPGSNAAWGRSPKPATARLPRPRDGSPSGAVGYASPRPSCRLIAGLSSSARYWSSGFSSGLVDFGCARARALFGSPPAAGLGDLAMVRIWSESIEAGRVG